MSRNFARVVKMVYERPHVTIDEVRFDLELSEQTARQHLLYLVEVGLVEVVRRDRVFKYIWIGV